MIKIMLPIFKRIIPWFLILPIIFSVAILNLPLQAEAQTNAELTKSLGFTPQVGIPGSEFEANKEVKVGSFNEATGKMQSDLLGRYMLAIINYALAAVAILATVVLMGGGLLWLTSRGDSGQIGRAKGLIGGSLTGMILLLCSWIILNTINPELTKFQSIDTKVIDTINYQYLVCCDTENGPKTTKIIEKDGKKIALEGENKGKAINCPGGTIPECGQQEVCVKYGKGDFFACVENLVCCQCSWSTVGFTNYACQYNHTVNSCAKYCGNKNNLLRGAVYYEAYSMKTHSCGSALLLQDNKCVFKEVSE